MDQNIAHFARNNPFSNDKTKKYDFVFHFHYPEYNFSRRYKFNVIEDDCLYNIRDKIAAMIGKNLQMKKAEMDKETEKDKDKTEKSEDSKVNFPKNKVNFLRNGKKMDYNMKFGKFQNIKDKLEFHILNETYQIRINMPKILNMELPKAIFVGFPVYPSLLDAILLDPLLSDYAWYKSSANTNWVFISNEQSYLPKLEDVNYLLKLKCTPIFENKVGEPFETVSDATVQIFYEKCPFEKRILSTMTSLQGNSFRVVSYNVLSDVYVRNDKFPYCPEYALNVDYRKQLILKELTGYNADIICLQEVDYKVYKNYLREEMSKLNYRSFYDPKLGRAEGLVMFFHNNRFTSLRKHRIILQQELQNNPRLSKLWKKVEYCTAVANKLISQNTVYQIVVLQPKDSPDDILVVGNTHLFYHPDARHIRILQAEICLEYTNTIIHQVEQKNKNSRISFIFCGDFNSNPPCGVVDLFLTGKVAANHEDWGKIPEEKVTDIKLVLKKPMKSAYGIPKFTNYTDDFKGCLDYIFYAKKFLALKKVVPLFSEEEMAANVALPSIVVPSDHVALVAEFQWKQDLKEMSPALEIGQDIFE